jgi:hypothetical protein
MSSSLEKAAAMAILVLVTAIMFHTSFHGAISSRNYNFQLRQKTESPASIQRVL